MNDENPAGGLSALSAGLERDVWDHFSAHYNDAKREELDYYPKLKAAWDEWQKVWQIASERERGECLAAVRGVMVTDHGLYTWKRCVSALEKRSNASFSREPERSGGESDGSDS